MERASTTALAGIILLLGILNDVCIWSGELPIQTRWIDQLVDSLFMDYGKRKREKTKTRKHQHSFFKADESLNMDDERKKSNRVAKAKVPDGNDDDDLLSFVPFPKMAKAMKDSKPVVKPDPSMTVGVGVAVAAANNTKAACKPKKEAKIKKAPPEKRLKRHRSKPTHGISTRINRARTQRLFLVHTSDIQHDAHPHGGISITFAVLGSTGNVYQVVLSKVPSCSCPDHAKGNLCKHILFVMLRVVGLESHSPLVY